MRIHYLTGTQGKLQVTYSVQKVEGTSFTPCKKGNSAGQGYVSNRHVRRKSIVKMFQSIANPPSTPQISTAIGLGKS